MPWRGVLSSAFSPYPIYVHASVNSGPAEADGGFWFRGEENDGAAGWAFKPEQYGPTWMGLPQGRGIWRYDGEIDSGFGGGLRAAATVVIDDPVFGMIAYVGTLNTYSDATGVTPRDGLNQRLHFLNVSSALHLLLDRDGFAPGIEVRLTHDLSEIAAELENRIGSPHTLTLTILGLPPGDYTLFVDTVRQDTVTAQEGQEARFLVQLPASPVTSCRVVRLEGGQTRGRAA